MALLHLLLENLGFFVNKCETKFLSYTSVNALLVWTVE